MFSGARAAHTCGLLMGPNTTEPVRCRITGDACFAASDCVHTWVCFVFMDCLHSMEGLHRMTLSTVGADYRLQTTDWTGRCHGNTYKLGDKHGQFPKQEKREPLHPLLRQSGWPMFGQSHMTVFHMMDAETRAGMNEWMDDRRLGFFE
ncbi:hypothetical protein JOB18_044230 [Solea senegalensis]|uniref:Uncharacterized protein n=1 Tax=Solea senegalensis TaxID=28829 RepID=A0AAV6RKQ3_SOLSE|nr:hypothetical protein JOB18_044230 [Solea senegalensis]